MPVNRGEATPTSWNIGCWLSGIAGILAGWLTSGRLEPLPSGGFGFFNQVIRFEIAHAVMVKVACILFLLLVLVRLRPAGVRAAIIYFALGFVAAQLMSTLR